MNKMDETVNTYENIFAEYKDSFNQEYLNGHVQFQEEIDNLVNLLDDESYILDVGTCMGSYPKYLTENVNKNFKVLGIDASAKMIEEAKKNAKNALFRVMDMRDMQLDDNSFDAIICLATLIHVDDENASIVLDKFNALLKIEGIMVINVQEVSDGIKEIYEDEPLNPKYKTYFNRYTKDFFYEWARNKNYEVIEVIDNYVNDVKAIGAPNGTKNRFSFIMRKK
ncbi:MAG: class I SAM-dependent methyltransferase [Bacilli bacterium]|nr:class I SAM-dependent methyltransferase [Bacilli bacterium]